MTDTLTTIGLGHYIALSCLLFMIGALGIALNRRHMIVVLMSIEIMLLAVIINFLAFSHFWGHLTGQVFALFVLAVAAAESAIGLAILVIVYRHRGSISVDEASDLKG